MASVRVERLPGRARIAAAQAGTDLGWVAGKVPADDVQAELAQIEVAGSRRGGIQARARGIDMNCKGMVKVHGGGCGVESAKAANSQSVFKPQASR